MIFNLYKSIRIRYSILAMVLLISFPNISFAQDKITIGDYDRAVGFLYSNYYNKTVFNLHIQPNWFPDSSGVWYIHHAPDTKNYYKLSLPEQVKTDLFDHQKLAQILSDSIEDEVKADNLPIKKIEYKSPKELLITVKSKRYILNTDTYTLRLPEKTPAKKSKRAAFS